MEKSLCGKRARHDHQHCHSQTGSCQWCTPLAVISASLRHFVQIPSLRWVHPIDVTWVPMPWLLPSYQRVVTSTWARLSFPTAKWALFPLRLIITDSPQIEWEVRKLAGKRQCSLEDLTRLGRLSVGVCVKHLAQRWHNAGTRRQLISFSTVIIINLMRRQCAHFRDKMW